MSVPYRDEGSGTAMDVTGIASHLIATYDIDLSNTTAGIVRADVNGINTTTGEALNVYVVAGYRVFNGVLSVTSYATPLNFSDYPGISAKVTASGSSLLVSVDMTIAGQMLNDIDVNLYASATGP